MEDRPTALRASAAAINRTIQCIRRMPTIRRNNSQRASAHFYTTYNPFASPHRARFRLWKTAALNERKRRLQTWKNKSDDYRTTISELQRQIAEIEQELHGWKKDAGIVLWNEMQGILFDANKEGWYISEDGARRRAIAKPVYQKRLQEKEKLEDHLVELRRPLAEVGFQMRKAREAFERTEKEALMQIITDAIAFLNSEKADEAREWAKDVSKQHWQRLREIDIPISPTVPLSIEYIQKQCDTNWRHEPGQSNGERGICCGVCWKEAPQAVCCKKCGTVVCGTCAEGLVLLQQYEEWLGDETERLFGASNGPGTVGN